METQGLNANFYSPLGHDSGGRGLIYNQRPVYKEYNYPRRAVQSSPNQVIDSIYGSPTYSSPRSAGSSERPNISPGNPIDMSNFKGTPGTKTDPEFVLKNPMFHVDSPGRTSVSMPGGIEYDIPNDNENISIYGNKENVKNNMVNMGGIISPPLKKEFSRNVKSQNQHSPHLKYDGYQNIQQVASPPHHNSSYKIDPVYIPIYNSNAVPSTMENMDGLQRNYKTYVSQNGTPLQQNIPPHYKPQQYVDPNNPHAGIVPQYSPNHQAMWQQQMYGGYTNDPNYQQYRVSPNNMYGYNNPYETIKRMEEERKEDKKIQQQMMETINEIREEKAREKEMKEKQKQSGYKTPSASSISSTPGYTIPQSEPIQQKSKMPEYELMSDLEKDGYKEKFRNNYNLLKLRYPIWNIEVPDFNVLPLRTIHERYEAVVRMICIYQTAMKWKVYLVVILAGIEYYVGYKKNQAWCRGLLESQIKTIHKFDTYLIEFATMFYSDEAGEEYPLWMRFLGTFASGLVTFGSINGAAKSFGMDGNEVTENLLFEADKFVSPPEGTAKLHSDGISDVPEPPDSGSLQEPNTAINGIGMLFNMAKGFFGGSNSSTSTQSTAAPQTAQPATPAVNIQTKNVTVDDLDDADL